jgi:hypothetical protein
VATSIELPMSADAEQSYLEQRLREEAEAAAAASSVPAMLAHVNMAIAYARRFGERCDSSAPAASEAWITENRVW